MSSLANVFKEIIIKDRNRNKKIVDQLVSNTYEFEKMYNALYKYLKIDLIHGKKKKYSFELLIDKDIYSCEVGLLVTLGGLILCMTCKVHRQHKLPFFNPIEELKRRQGISNHKFRKIKK